MRNQHVPNCSSDIEPILVAGVMIIESDPDVAYMLREVLKNERIPTIIATSWHDAWQVTKGLHPLLFLINTHLSDGDGVLLYDQIQKREHTSLIPTIMLSTELQSYQQQLKERNIAGLSLPLNIDDLTQKVASLLAS